MRKLMNCRHEKTVWVQISVYRDLWFGISWTHAKITKLRLTWFNNFEGHFIGGQQLTDVIHEGIRKVSG